MIDMKIDMNFEAPHFIQDGRPTFLVTGEFPYYRINPEHWRDRLQKAKALGVTVVSCYIPWNLHEYQEGKIDFDGKSGFEQRNINRFFRYLEELDLKLIAKPGPFICAEYRRGAIPEWLTTNYPQVLMKNVSGKDVLFSEDLSPLPNYLEPTYLCYVQNWYRQVVDKLLMGLEKKDILVAVQVENEIPYSSLYLADPFSWGYENFTVYMFQVFLRDKYQDCDNYNVITGEKYASFMEVKAPVRPDFLSKSDWLLLQDWIEFKEYFAKQVLQVYSRIFRESGISVPLYHDLIMLENESPVNYGKMAEALPLAVNFWLENHPVHDFRSYCRALARVKLMRNAQPKRAAYCSESNWCWGNEQEFDFLFRMMIPYLDGINIYTLVDGANAGQTGETNNSSLPEPYPGQAPINLAGENTVKAKNIKQLTRFIQNCGGEIVNAVSEAEVALINYEPYNAPHVSQFWGGITKERFRDVVTNFPSMNNWLFEMIGSLVKNNIPFDLVEISGPIPAKLDQYKVIFAPGYDYMSASAQQILITYIRNGGKLVLSPTMPQFNDDLTPCDKLLKATFGKLPLKQVTMFHNFDWEGFGNPGTVFGTANIPENPEYLNSHSDVKVLGKLSSGCPIVFEKRVGKGKMIYAGIELQRLPDLIRLTRNFLEHEGIDFKIKTRNNGIHIAVKSAKDIDTVFMINLTAEDIQCEAEIVGSENSKYQIQMKIPAKRINIIHFRQGKAVAGSIWGNPAFLQINQVEMINKKNDTGSALNFTCQVDGEIIYDK
ncbi:MAG TPA: hypothetical protein DDW65_20070 [Firmicutes bacterium]|jgi:beta-galactosidase|nr:hypothetical protein [Bacillota bacterium]